MTVVDDPAAVAEQLTNPAPNVTDGDAGTVNPVANTAVIVPPPASSPDELDVNPTVQLVCAPAACDAPVNHTLDTDGSIACTSTGNRASFNRRPSVHPRHLDRVTDQRAPAGVTSAPARIEHPHRRHMKADDTPAARRTQPLPSCETRAVKPGAESRHRHTCTPTLRSTVC